MGVLALPESSRLNFYLKSMVDLKASDLFLTVGAPPTVKVEGVMRPLPLAPLVVGSVRLLAESILNETQMRRFGAELEYDLAGYIAGLGRFRFNVFMQRGEVGIVARNVPSQIPSIEDLKMPAILKKLTMLKRGLVLIVGAAGSGKSTSLASMLDYRNSNTPGHILTVEDPIEFIHSHKQSLVNQREVGIDTLSFDQALRHAMREAPDVIMIGEIRDRLTVQHAMNYAETGHLCVSTMHANNANQAIERMLNFFPEDAHNRILMDLSMNLHGVVAQRLIQGAKQRLVPATEVMLLSPYVSDLIQKGQIDQLRAVMGKSNEVGMNTFDQSLFDMYARGDLTMEQAIDNADSKTDVSVRMRIEMGATPNLTGLTI